MLPAIGCPNESANFFCIVPQTFSFLNDTKKVCNFNWTKIIAESRSTIICIEVIQFIMNFYVCVSPDWFTMEDYDELFGSFIRKGVWMVCAQTGPEEVECLV